MICPFISDGDKILKCHPRCALLIDGECAMRVLAKARLSEESGGQDNQSEQSKKNT